MSEKRVLAGTYEIIGYLQSGSGGDVYKAYHRRLKKEVVLKKIRHKGVSMNINRQEVDILKNLRHTYLPQVLDFFMEDGEYYTVMTYVPGKSFKQLLNEHAVFSQNQLIRWGQQLCSALYYLHSQNPPIIHGDIKPANIMVTPEGNICLIDFNISFYMDDNTVLGYTDGYTSPEQYIIALDAQSAKSIPMHDQIDEKSDIYSLGATFYHLITGQKLQRNRTGREKDALQTHVSEAFSSVLMKSIEVDRNKRYRTAREFYQAFQNIYKKDKRYRQLLLHQRLIRGGLVTLLGISIVTVGYGVHEMKLEKTEKYNDLVAEQVSYRESGDYKKEEDTYKEAVKLLPDKLESYYQNAYTLYEQQEYQKCIDFVEYDVLKSEKADLIDDRITDIYYLEAESYFELEEYDKSVEIFDRLFQYGGFDNLYYRDYAIALAYDGKTDKAQEVLQEAIDHDLTEDSIYYAKGEIEKSMGQTDSAISEFQQCIAVSEDNNLKMRSYVLISEIYEKNGKLEDERALLLEAKNALPVENQMILLERLVQTDIELANQGNTSLRDEAIEVSKEIITQGWDTYTTYNNLAILNEKQGNLGEVESILNQMKELYGDDYNIEKRFAFLEIDKQEQKANSNRDYSAFASYYERARTMYYEQMKNNDTDAEMQLLDNVYQQAVNGGWIR